MSSCSPRAAVCACAQPIHHLTCLLGCCVACVCVCVCVVRARAHGWQVRKVRKPKGVSGLIDIENPNHRKATVIKAKDIDTDAKVQLTRRER